MTQAHRADLCPGPIGLLPGGGGCGWGARQGRCPTPVYAGLCTKISGPQRPDRRAPTAPLSACAARSWARPAAFRGAARPSRAYPRTPWRGRYQGPARVASKLRQHCVLAQARHAIGQRFNPQPLCQRQDRCDECLLFGVCIDMRHKVAPDSQPAHRAFANGRDRRRSAAKARQFDAAAEPRNRGQGVADQFLCAIGSGGFGHLQAQPIRRTSNRSSSHFNRSGSLGLRSSSNESGTVSVAAPRPAIVQPRSAESP